jgi:hypothetical protein
MAAIAFASMPKDTSPYAYHPAAPDKSNWTPNGPEHHYHSHLHIPGLVSVKKGNSRFGFVTKNWLSKIPGYMDDMAKLADFIDTKPILEWEVADL